ncbi:MAG: alpha/beta hydrolase [Acidobacteria bacterium]|nr:alpha/beta hydrolase [Acidobacteriota bacterium]
MNIIDRGGGTPIVLVPGIQGRWEWMRPAVEALAARCRVLTFSLADEPAKGLSFDTPTEPLGWLASICLARSARRGPLRGPTWGRFDEATGFWGYVEQVRQALDASGVEKATICGVSYGGLIAGAFAARHPDRVSALVLVSALPPSWTPDRRARFYLRAPRLLTPVFMVASLRMYREIATASSGVFRGAAAAVGHAWRVLTHRFSPGLMARRVRMLGGIDLPSELARVDAPTLLLTGDGSLDRVVPIAATHEYLRMWPHARVATLARTGHLGMITRPDEFARIVVSFAETAEREVGQVGRVGQMGNGLPPSHPPYPPYPPLKASRGHVG